MLDGQVGDAPAGIDAVRTIEGVGRTSVETPAAGAAMMAGMGGFVRRQFIGIDQTSQITFQI